MSVKCRQCFHVPTRLFPSLEKSSLLFSSFLFGKSCSLPLLDRAFSFSQKKPKNFPFTDFHIEQWQEAVDVFKQQLA